MSLDAELAAAVEAFKQLLSIQPPEQTPYWNPPAALRQKYVELAETIVYTLDKLKAYETSALHTGGQVESRLPADVLVTLREQLRPREDSIWDALNVLDPANSLLREMMIFRTRPSGRNGQVRHTFEQGVEEVEKLIERNPDMDFQWLHPNLALEVLSSKIIAFEPDAWLDRIAELTPVRTSVEHENLPPGVRLRLREFFQAYAFGCWLSALSLTRATLEYSLYDNTAKLGLALATDTAPSERTPSLYRLIEFYKPRTPNLVSSMHRIRELGNQYLHPTAESVQRPSSSMRAHHAAEGITLLVNILEGLYLASNA